jgi:RNA polymerase sigma factor (sigma-70 family)
MSSQGTLTGIADFFRRERGALTGYVRRLIADAAERDSEDIVQDVALNLFEKTDISVPLEYLSSYIYSSLRNRVIDYLRKRKRTVSLDAPMEEGDDAPTLKDVLHDANYDAAEELERKQIREQLMNAIDRLDRKHKAVVIATEFEGKGFAELSDEWGMPLGTLLARKSRAVKKIRKLLLEDLAVHE